jgi:hypothetical protein
LQYKRRLLLELISMSVNYIPPRKEAARKAAKKAVKKKR